MIRTDTDILSRRKFFSVLGVATLALAVPPTVLMVSTAEAQVQSPTPPLPLRKPADRDDVWRGVRRAQNGVRRDVKRAQNGVRRDVKGARPDVKRGAEPPHQPLRSKSRATASYPGRRGLVSDLAPLGGAFSYCE
jgi:hypothetical protein